MRQLDFSGSRQAGNLPQSRPAIRPDISGTSFRIPFATAENPSMSDFSDSFELKWHGNTIVITPASDIEDLKWDLIEQAAEIVMSPMREQEVPMVVFELSEVSYFGSVFLALLLRCHKLVKTHGGELVLCGASDLAVELLRITALDTLWAIYDTREEALEAVGA
jgi:anti-anti-sigma factor